MAASAPFNFGGLTASCSSRENSEIAFIPVPFEKTSSWIKGSRRGPRALIEASRHMELYDIETDSEVYRRGIYTSAAIKEKNAPAMIENVYETNIKFLREGKFPVTAGGEHTVSLGAIKAAGQFAGEDFAVLQLDAHSDLRDSYEGDPLSHACVMARVREMGIEVFSVGIRSMDVSEKKMLDMEKTVFAREFFTDYSERMKKLLRSMKKNIFIDIDLDVFDPCLIPSTGTPEPGGLSWGQVTGILKDAAQRKNVVGLSVSELCPGKESEVSQFSAAVLIYKALSYIKETA